MPEYLIAGIDEVGRGSLAGPIMAVAAVFDGNLTECPVEGVQDSKLFGSGINGQRARLPIFDLLLASPYLLDFGIGEIGPELIDQKGIHWANQRVFQLALEHLRRQPTFLIVDGHNPVMSWAPELQLVAPKADRDHWQVGAASIIAKVLRDRLMRDYHPCYPVYGFVTNSGYGSSQHQRALLEHGPTPLHRQTFIKKIMRSGAAVRP